MGKGTRLKAIRKEEKALPTVINTVAFNMLDNGQVSVTGPITDPALLCDVLSKGFRGLSLFYGQQGGKPRIVMPKSDLILPH